ncbi:MAG TPA: DUF92 domain-containing protein [Chloroflexia bacterium]
MGAGLWLILLGYAAAGVVGYLGARAGALSRSGGVAACVVGGTIFGFGGLEWAALLVLFFVSSSVLSFYKASDLRKKRAAEAFEKGGRRDAAQVLANGGVAALLAFLSYFAGSELRPLLFAAFAGTLAAATADTWATEIGVLSSSPPRLLTTGRVVDAGTSGAVTWMGSMATAGGALLMALGAALLTSLELRDQPSLMMAARALPLLAAVFVGGITGALADSFLGATVQAGYRCRRCDKPTESRVHNCGSPTHLVRGVAWVNNDLVNASATVTGAAVAGLLWSFISGSITQLLR